MALTPDQRRKLSSDIQAFNKDWKYNTATKEILRKDKSGFKRFLDRFWKRKYRLRTLYYWTSDNWATSQMMPFEIPLEHDMINKPKSLPTYFSLVNGWTIPTKDLKTLTHGPLISEKQEILVKQGGLCSYYWNKIWPIISIFATIGGIISLLVWIISLF